jgi:hypothetical protein
MTLDELAARFNTESSDPVVQRLGQALLDWKATDATVTDLAKSVEHYIGTTWIASEAEHEEVYRAWAKFRDQVIGRIGGMTMNERLYHMSLLDQFEATKPDQSRVYQKLLAEP